MMRMSLLLVALLGVATPLEAADARMFDFRLQGQATILALIDPVEPEFGGLEAHVSASMYGFGLAAGLLWERFDGGAKRGGYDGGALNIGIQLRPVTFINRKLYRIIDPHIDIGGLIGGGDGPGGRTFRAAFYVGAGLDLGISPAVLTLHYRFQAARTPGLAASHLLCVGIGARVAE